MKHAGLAAADCMHRCPAPARRGWGWLGEPGTPADRRLGLGLPLQRPVVAEVDLAEDAGEVLLHPGQGRRLDAVLARGHHHQLARLPEPLQAVERPCRHARRLFSPDPALLLQAALGRMRGLHTVRSGSLSWHHARPGQRLACIGLFSQSRGIQLRPTMSTGTETRGAAAAYLGWAGCRRQSAAI